MTEWRELLVYPISLLTLGGCLSQPENAAAERHYLLALEGDSIKKAPVRLTADIPSFTAEDWWLFSGTSTGLVVHGLEGAPVVDSDMRPVGMLRSVRESAEPQLLSVTPIKSIIDSILRPPLHGINESGTPPVPEHIWRVGGNSGKMVVAVRWWGDGVSSAGIASVGYECDDYFLLGIPSDFWGWRFPDGPVALALFEADVAGIGRVNDGCPMPLVSFTRPLGVTERATQECFVARRTLDSCTIDLRVVFSGLHAEHVVHSYTVVRDKSRWRAWCVECVDADLDLRGVVPNSSYIVRVCCDGTASSEWRMVGTYGAGWQREVLAELGTALDDVKTDISRIELTLTPMQ